MERMQIQNPKMNIIRKNADSLSNIRRYGPLGTQAHIDGMGPLCPHGTQAHMERMQIYNQIISKELSVVWAPWAPLGPRPISMVWAPWAPLGPGPKK